MILCRTATAAYVHDEDYATAVTLLKTLVYLAGEIPNFERLILDYLRGISDKYDLLLAAYLEAVDKEIDNRATSIFHNNYLKAWYAAKNAITVYEKLKAMGRRSHEIPKKKNLWFNLIKQKASQMEFSLHSGKK